VALQRLSVLDWLPERAFDAAVTGASTLFSADDGFVVIPTSHGARLVAPNGSRLRVRVASAEFEPQLLLALEAASALVVQDLELRLAARRAALARERNGRGPPDPHPAPLRRSGLDERHRLSGGLFGVLEDRAV
jgi:hypothetical protein